MGPADVREALEQRKILVDKIREADHLLAKAKELPSDPDWRLAISYLERQQAIGRSMVEQIDEELFGAPPLKVSH